MYIRAEKERPADAMAVKWLVRAAGLERQFMKEVERRKRNEPGNV